MSLTMRITETVKQQIKLGPILYKKQEAGRRSAQNWLRTRALKLGHNFETPCTVLFVFKLAPCSVARFLGSAYRYYRAYRAYILVTASNSLNFSRRPRGILGNRTPYRNPLVKWRAGLLASLQDAPAKSNWAIFRVQRPSRTSAKTVRLFELKNI